MKEVVIQNARSKLVLTANVLQKTHSDSSAIIDVTQEHYEPNRSGQGFKYILCNLLLKVQVCESWR